MSETVSGWFRRFDINLDITSDINSGYAVDETIHHCHRAGQELWRFCWSGGVGANIEIVARTLEQLADDGETVNWCERIASRELS